MHKRWLSLRFTHLATDRMVIRQPELKGKPFALVSPERGRMLVKASNATAASSGVFSGMVVADARTLLPSLEVFPYDPQLEGRLLTALARWCLRYTPIAATDLPDGLILDITGCAHLWGGELPYLEAIVATLQSKGYSVRGAIADTVGMAWALARYGQELVIAPPGTQRETLLSLPPASLRLDQEILERLQKLGFRQVKQFIDISPPILRRRFGEALLTRLGQALGTVHEYIDAVQPIRPYREELPCMEPIVTSMGIEIALKRLLEMVCERMRKEGKGLRAGVFKGHRIDGKVEQINIGTGRPSHNQAHLFKLFELKIASIEPALGIERFLLEVPLVEDLSGVQDTIWGIDNLDNTAVAELLDNIGGKLGMDVIHRYLPQEHHWPERSIKEVPFFEGQPDTEWATALTRPLELWSKPEPIEVMVHLPDYPPRHFRYKGKIYKIAKADGPERIEQEWWLQTGPPRDYYCVEDEEGIRYWIFRLGLYGEGDPQWFLHGIFA